MIVEEVVYTTQPRDLCSAGDTPVWDQLLECRKHSMKKHQCLPLGTSLTLPFLWVVTKSPLGNAALDPALLPPFLAPQIILLMSQSTAPLQAPLVVMGLDVQSLRQNMGTAALLLIPGTT